MVHSMARMRYQMRTTAITQGTACRGMARTAAVPRSRMHTFGQQVITARRLAWIRIRQMLSEELSRWWRWHPLQRVECDLRV